MNTISQRKLFEGIGDIAEPVEVVRNDRATGQMTKLGVWVPAAKLAAAGRTGITVVAFAGSAVAFPAEPVDVALDFGDTSRAPAAFDYRPMRETVRTVEAHELPNAPTTSGGTVTAPKGSVRAITPAPRGTFNPVPKPGAGKKK